MAVGGSDHLHWILERVIFATQRVQAEGDCGTGGTEAAVRVLVAAGAPVAHSMALARSSQCPASWQTTLRSYCWQSVSAQSGPGLGNAHAGCGGGTVPADAALHVSLHWATVSLVLLRAPRDHGCALASGMPVASFHLTVGRDCAHDFVRLRQT